MNLEEIIKNCKVCNGKGEILKEGHLVECECREKVKRYTFYNSMRLPLRFFEYELSFRKGQNLAIKKVIDNYINTLQENYENGLNVVMISKNIELRSAFLIHILKSLYSFSYTGAYTTLVELFVDKQFNNYLRQHFLMIDNFEVDVDITKFEYELLGLTRLLEYRYLNKLPVLISTSYTKNEFESVFKSTISKFIFTNCITLVMKE